MSIHRFIPSTPGAQPGAVCALWFDPQALPLYGDEQVGARRVAHQLDLSDLSKRVVMGRTE